MTTSEVKLPHVWIVIDHRCSEPQIDSIWASPEAADNYIDELNMRHPEMANELSVAPYAVKGHTHDGSCSDSQSR